MTETPKFYTERNGKTYNANDELVEFVAGRWMVVKNGDRLGWWRYHDHYDSQGYCDNPGRGY